ncbi:Otud3, partial [Symbiodinium necroappetens]
MEFSPADARCLQLSYHDGEHYNSVRFEWDLCPGKPVSFLSLQQLKMKDSDVVALLEEVKYSLPPNHSFEEATLRSTLLQSKYDAGAAVELLLNKLAGVTEPQSAPVESKDVAAAAPEQGPSDASPAAATQ